MVCCARPRCGHPEADHVAVSVLVRDAWVNTAGCCIVADCDCHEFAGAAPAPVHSEAMPCPACVAIVKNAPDGCDDAGEVADYCHAKAVAVPVEVKWPRPSVIQLNAHLVAEPCDHGWTATANLGLGLTAVHVSRSSSLAILGALKLALAELEARHA